MEQASQNTPPTPDMKVSVRQLFGIDSDMQVPAYSTVEEHVPDTDPDYIFDRDTTLAILAGFSRNRRVMITGYHGTGKSTHVEQVAARLNWPCIRINLDSHVSRVDLVGKDAIVLQDGKQVHGVPRRYAALGLAEQRRPVLRRIRRGPARCDVRDPARARVVRPVDAARPEARHQASPLVPPLRNRQYGGPRRYVGPVSRHAADQPGPDGPLVDRRDPELSARTIAKSTSSWPRRRITAARRRGATSSTRWCGSRISPANAFTAGDLSTVMSPRTVITWARECRDLRRHRLRVPPDLPQ